MSGKIIMIGSMKGGVSKTVTTFNLAYSLSKLGRKVLAVDFDSQANLSTCLGVEDVTAVPVTIGNLMMAQIEEEELPERNEYIQTRNGVDFISSSMVLSAVDAKLRLEMGAEKMLSDILEKLRGSYDYILIDTSPSLGALTINAMSAADEVLITVNPQLLAMMGLQDFLKTVKKIKNRINSKLSVAGILLTMCDSRTNLCKVITEEVTETFEGQIKIFESMIPNTVKVGESVYYSEPLVEYAPDSKAFRPMNGKLNFSTLDVQDGEGNVDSFEPESKKYSNADTYIRLLKDLGDYVTEHYPKYAKYVELINLLGSEYDMKTASQIMGKADSTLYDWVKRLRPIYDEFRGTIDYL